MSTKDSRHFSRFEPPVVEQAAEWLITLKDPDVARADKEGLLAWLQRSPVHVEEFLRVSSLDAELSGRQLGFDTKALVAECGRLDAIEALRPRGSRPEDSASGRRSPRAIALAASVAGALMLALGIAWITLRSPALYVTERGEQRVVALPDGSLMQLNTQTRARVAYGKTARHIVLLEGEALFTAAKDVSRPFIVKAGAHSIQATGTRFNVSAHPTRTVVTVIEGKVVVRPLAYNTIPTETPSDDAVPDTVALSPGQQLVAAGPTAAQVRAVEPERVTAWQEWKLYFEDESLAEVVEEFNRYNRSELRLDDPRLAQRRISGVFFANQPDSLIAFIASRDPIEVTEEGRGLRVIRRR